MFYSGVNLQRHMDRLHSSRYKGPLKCPYCSFACSEKQELTSHCSNIHRFKCDICQKTFSSYPGLKNHNKTMHGSEDLLYKCKTCGKCFESTSRLKIHERSHSDDKMFKCVLCGKGYKYKCTLENHMRVCDCQQ